MEIKISSLPWKLTGAGGEDVFIIDLAFDPVHEQGDVAWGRQLGGFFILGRRGVRPQILELWAPRHFGAGFFYGFKDFCCHGNGVF